MRLDREMVLPYWSSKHGGNASAASAGVAIDREEKRWALMIELDLIGAGGLAGVAAWLPSSMQSVVAIWFHVACFQRSREGICAKASRVEPCVECAHLSSLYMEWNTL